MTDTELAAKVRAASKGNSRLVSIQWHRHGSALGRAPGTEYLVTIRPPVRGAPLRSFLTYVPAPRNCRQAALAVTCDHLAGLTPSIPLASVKPHETN